MKSSHLLCCAILLCPFYAFSQAGDLDPSFGEGNGLVTTSFFSNQPAQGYGIAVSGDRIAVAGVTKTPSGQEHAVLACYLADGEQDNSFNGSGSIIIDSDESSYSTDVAIQPDGKILLVVNQTTGLSEEAVLYRFRPDGSPDNTFGTAGKSSTHFGAKYLSANAIALQSDGKIVLGGYIGFAQDTFDRFIVARFLPDGSPDMTFDGDGSVLSFVGESYTNVAAVVIQPDTKIIAAGYGVFNGNDDFAVVRYNNDGSLDQSFGESGIAHATISTNNDICYGAAVLPDGRIVTGGYAYSSVTGKSAFAAVRFMPDGTLDKTFHGNGMNVIVVSGHSDGARGLALQPDGKILLCGYAHSDVNGSDMAIVRLTESGVPDFTFGEDGAIVYDDPNKSSVLQHIVLQPDGKILGTGFERVDGINSMRVARVFSGITVGTQDDVFSQWHLSLYPNPVTKYVTVQYELDNAETLSMRLYDMQGTLVQDLLASAYRESGKHREMFTLESYVVPGHYVVNVETRSGIKSLPIVTH